jgi:UDP-N-acetylmuramate dehydrogenase
MEIQEHVPLAPKTTMRIGGTARYFAEPQTKSELEEVLQFATDKNLPLIVLGGGSNTIFEDGEVQAVVMRIQAAQVSRDGNTVTVQAGKHLPILINELAEQGLNLSPLTGIPGRIGGAIVGNAGQGPKGVWIDSCVESVTAFADGQWKTFSKEECEFSYRESVFKKVSPSPIIWEIRLTVPSGNAEEIREEIERLLQKRIETQPHTKTAGSCFKAVGGTPAWQLIDTVNMRGAKVGGVSISEKHANFLINDGSATFADTIALIEKTKSAVPEELEVEMRLVQEDGSLA